MTGSPWSARGLTFGAVAAAYEHFRLGYPQAVVDVVRNHSRLPLRRAVEIGAGTGKATRVFTASGIAVTAIEPDPAMLAELARHVTGDVVPVLSTFEDHAPVEPPDPADPVDLVYAAAALHWTDPGTRWARIAALLRPEGVVASFGGAPDLEDEALRDRVREVAEPFVGDDDLPIADPAPDAPLRWPATEMRDAAGFTDVRQVVLERRLVMAADAYIGHLSTVSAYLLLPAALRGEVLARVREVLPDDVDVVADVTVHLARRR